MVKLDEYDKRIIAELFKNSRTPNSVIAKSIKKSKEFVFHRIENLKKKGIFLGSVPLIDYSKLGVVTCFVNIKFNNHSLTDELTLINKLKNKKNIIWISKCVGVYDLIFQIVGNSYEELQKEVLKIVSKSQLICNYDLQIIFEELLVGSLYADSRSKIAEVKSREISNTEASPREMVVLNAILHNPDATLIDFAQSTKIPVTSVLRIKKSLEEKKIIKNYVPSLDYGKLGVNWYYVMLSIDLSLKSNKDKFKFFINSNPDVLWRISSFGVYNVVLSVLVKEENSAINIVSKIVDEFKDIVHKSEFIKIKEQVVFKYYLPEDQ